MKMPDHAKKHPLGTIILWIVLPLLMAGATLALISETNKKEREIAISVSFKNLAENLIVLDTPRPAVRFLVSGKPAALKTIEPEGASCQLDVSDLGQGSHTIPVRPMDIRLPNGVSLSMLLTPTLTIRLGVISHKTVDVVVVLEGTLAPGFAVAEVNLKPNRIVLAGTADLLAGIDTAKTHPISIEGASESFKKEVPLNLPDTVAVDPPPRIVIAGVDIRERIITRVLENIPVATEGIAASHRIAPDGITLTVSGPEAIVNAIESDPTFSVTIDLNGLAPGTHSLKATIKLPVRTKLVHVTPEQFSVIINK